MLRILKYSLLDKRGENKEEIDFLFKKNQQKDGMLIQCINIDSN